MPLMNYEDNLVLAWSSTCVITNSTDTERLAITDAKVCSSCNFINSR